MEVFGLLGFIFGLVAFLQVTMLKEKIKTFEKRLNSEPITLPEHAVVHVKKLVAADQQIKAIKYVREQTNASLLEAKKYVDSLD